MLTDGVVSAVCTLLGSLVSLFPSVGFLTNVITQWNGAIAVINPYMGLAGLVIDFSVVVPMVAAFLAFRFLLIQWRAVIWAIEHLPFV